MSDRANAKLAELCERARQDPGLPKANPTTSYWQCPPSEAVATLQSPQFPECTDVVVIGSGITGCSIARHLLQYNHSIDVTVLEARNVCSGATGRNGGHIKAVPEFSFVELQPIIGKEGADEVFRFTLANVEELLKVSASLPEKLRKYGEVRAVESLNVFIDEKDFEEFQGVVAEFEKEHPSHGRMISMEELEKDFGVYNAAGAYLASAGAGWPYRLITGMFAEMIESNKRRFRIETKTPAQSIIRSSDSGAEYPYQVQTPRGSIRAKQVIHATNAHAGHLLPKLRGPLYPVRGQMTAQRPSHRFGVQGGSKSWSVNYGSGFDYMTQSGQSGEIFLGGGLAQGWDRGLGEIGNTRDDVNTVLARAHLSGILNSVFSKDPEDVVSEKVLAAWTGVMGFTADGMPLVGPLTQEITGRNGEGEWVAAGFNGYGMANAWLSGKHIANAVLKREDDSGLPRAYKLTMKRLDGLDPKNALHHWMTALGVD